MRTGENMVTLEKLRLREVALNSLLAKMGKDLRVKATEVRKNNVQKPAFGIGIAGASLQIRCYPTPEDMAMSDLELLNELAKKFQEATSGVAVVDMLPSREELIAHLMPRVMGSANAGWLREAGRPCKELLALVRKSAQAVAIHGSRTQCRCRLRARQRLRQLQSLRCGRCRSDCCYRLLLSARLVRFRCLPCSHSFLEKGRVPISAPSQVSR